MAEVTRPRHVALLVPNPRIELWEAECSGTQAGPRAGVPEPEQVSALALAATGDQTSSSAGVEVMTRRAGYPVRAATFDSDSSQVVDRGAQFVWRNVGDSDTSWRGWDPPSMIVDWQAAVWTDASGNLKYVQDAVIAAAHNGDLLVIAQVREVSASGGEYRLECIRRTAASSTWTRVLIEGEATAPSQDYQPAVVVLPSGRVLVYRWLRQSTGSTVNALRLWYSDDAGLTWSFGGDTIAGRGTTNTITWCRAAYSGQQVLLLAVTSSGDIEQYASSDLGLTFEYVGLNEISGSAASVDVCPADIGFVVVHVNTLVGTLGARAFRTANAFEKYTANAEVTIDADVAVGEYGVTIIQDDTGILWCHYISDTSYGLAAFMSADDGRTWCDMSGAYNTTADTSTTFQYLTACWWRGQAVIAHNWAANPGNEDTSLGISYLGGYTTVPVPRVRSSTSMAWVSRWTTIWLPFDLPGDCGWTAAGTAATEALETPGLLRLNTTAANMRTYTRTVSAGLTTGIHAIIDLAAVSGGAITTNQRSLRVEITDGATASYAVEIRIGTAGIRVYDGVSGTLIGIQQDFNTLLRTQIRVAIQNDDVATWYRTATTTGGEREWVVGPTTGGLTPAGAVAASTVVFGHRATGASACETVFYQMHASGGTHVGRNIALGVTNPTDLVGRLYAWRGRGVYVADEVAIQARSGPTLLGEAWTISTAYDYGRSRVLDPRPRRAHRTTDLATTVKLAFKWATVDTPLDSGLFGIYLGEKNLGRITVDWRDAGSGAWVNPATYDLHFDADYTRSGEAVVPNGTTSAIGYVPRDEFAGASFEVDDQARRIAHHPDGRWATTGVKLVMHLDGIDDTETASATGRIVPRQALLILPISATYSGVRITQVAPDVDNPSVYQGYWEVGRFLAGTVHILADDPAETRAIEYQDGAEIAEARDRSRRSRVAAPPRRIIELSLTDGVDTTELADGDPDYYEWHDARSAIGGTPGALAGLQRALDGGATQVVYIPRLTSEAAQVMQLRSQAILCRIAGPIRIETVLGDELADEFVRVATIPLEEDV